MEGKKNDCDNRRENPIRGKTLNLLRPSTRYREPQPLVSNEQCTANNVHSARPCSKLSSLRRHLRDLALSTIYGLLFILHDLLPQLAEAQWEIRELLSRDSETLAFLTPTSGPALIPVLGEISSTPSVPLPRPMTTVETSSTPFIPLRANGFCK